MTSLAQELRDLKSQLQIVEEIRSEWEKDKEWEEGMTDLVKDTKTKLVELFGQSLHRLERFDPGERAVEKVVKKIPSCLSFVIRGTRLPIQSAASSFYVSYENLSSVKYIPLLAREGVKHNVGGEGMRGGLLCGDVLHDLVCSSHPEHPKEKDRICVDVFEQLKKEGLLMKEDIRNHDLIYLSGAMDGLENFEPVLEVLLEKYPNQAGYLFQKNNAGITAFEELEENAIEEEIMQSINSILSPKCSFPILHHALVAVPKYRDLFQNWFPWAYSLKDHNGRSLHQAVLAADGNCVKDNISIFASMSDDQIRTKDPVNTLYPFAAVASGEEGDLQKCFYLLRRQPCVLDPWSTVVRHHDNPRNKRRERDHLRYYRSIAQYQK
ncbi:hypothetical protein CTEN210_02980 [Chaetoceros tenuissimus]|uniref:Uncharacterized protein n=1 Tax=Chaetoceros tenuissimus TaxID=426638 RepID=A0AAD3CKF0_9STRA|nr:hypothetical protein CTEN210_02980 [Chaetoceros tenuissimus]